MRLSIGGLEIRPWVWRKAFEEGGGYDSDAAEDRAAGVALGYVAQVKRLGVPRPGKEHACTACLLSSRPLARLGHDCGMPLWPHPPPTPTPLPTCSRSAPPGPVLQVAERLGSYLGVVLRYPLVLRGSRSAVVDCQPPAGMW